MRIKSGRSFNLMIASQVESKSHENLSKRVEDEIIHSIVKNQQQL